MQGRVRLKLNTNNLFTNIREKSLLIFLAYMLILLAYLLYTYKSSMTQAYVILLYQSDYHTYHVKNLGKNLGTNKKWNTNFSFIFISSL